MSIHALIVGVSNYDLIGAPNLEFCKNDIKYFSEALVKGLSVKEEQIVKLGENDVVKKQSFISALKKFDFEVEEDENEDTFIFYFSGHGRINCNKHLLTFSDGYLETEDLIAIWKTQNNQRFQNYKAIFTLLPVQIITRKWINDIVSGNKMSQNSPKEWRIWITK